VCETWCLLLQIPFSSKLDALISQWQPLSAPAISVILSLAFLLFGGTEGWTQAPQFLGQCSATWAKCPQRFCFSYFWDRVFMFAWADMDHSPPTHSFLGQQVWATTSSLLVKMGVSLTFWPCWAWTVIFWIPASQVAKIKVSHHTWPFLFFKYKNFRTVLGLQQNWAKNRWVSSYFRPQTHTPFQLSPSNPSGTFVTVHEPILKYHAHNF
jgi:hypothetical protein